MSIKNTRFIVNKIEYRGILFCIYIFLIVEFLTNYVKLLSAETITVNARLEKNPGRYQVAKFQFEEVAEVYSITLWILIGSLAKIG